MLSCLLLPALLAALQKKTCVDVDPVTPQQQSFNCSEISPDLVYDALQNDTSPVGQQCCKAVSEAKGLAGGVSLHCLLSMQLVCNQHTHVVLGLICT